MRYLVTGCYGFIGFHLCQRLVALGHEVIGADRIAGANSPKGGRVERLAKLPQFRFVQCNLASEDAVRKLLTRSKPAIVVHLAAQYSVAPLTAELLQRYIDSVASNAYMAWHANAVGVEHYVYASSTFVQPGQDSAHAYGWSKACVEKFAAVAGSQNKPWRGMSVTGLRYGSTFGAFCRPDIGIYQLARKLLRGEQIETKPGSGFHYQCAFLDVRDAVDATLAVCNTRPEQPKALTVVANDHRKDLGELLHMLEDFTGVRAKCDWQGYISKGYGGIPVNQCDELERATGFRPLISMEQAVRDFAAWASAAHKAGTL